MIVHDKHIFLILDCVVLVWILVQIRLIFPLFIGFCEYFLTYNIKSASYQQQNMRLLSHNLLICNVAKCQKNNFPLLIEVQKSIYTQSQFSKDNILKLIKKLDWSALQKTVVRLGETNFPKQINNQFLENEEFLKKLHRIILDTHIDQGKLICPSCHRQYPIINGIPNMILHQNEI